MKTYNWSFSLMPPVVTPHNTITHFNDAPFTYIMIWTNIDYFSKKKVIPIINISSYPYNTINIPGKADLNAIRKQQLPSPSDTGGATINLILSAFFPTRMFPIFLFFSSGYLFCHVADQCLPSSPTTMGMNVRSYPFWEFLFSKC